jgi:hypothetical protein
MHLYYSNYDEGDIDIMKSLYERMIQDEIKPSLQIFEGKNSVIIIARPII